MRTTNDVSSSLVLFDASMEYVEYLSVSVSTKYLGFVTFRLDNIKRRQAAVEQGLVDK